MDIGIVRDPERSFLDRIGLPDFPCVGAKSALAHGDLRFHEATDLRCGAGDAALLSELQDFAANAPPDAMFTSFVALFPDTPRLAEADFEAALWQRLQALHRLDARAFDWDPNVSADPASPRFSMSLGGRAFYVIGAHPGASRKARRFACATLVFNLHSQFEALREDGRYEKLRAAITERDIAFSGSRNPMLAAHGEASEARQYSGRQVETNWRCPFSAQQSIVPRKAPGWSLERLPKCLDLVPMVLQWCWLGLRHGGITLPSTTNPGITSGGLVGEGKLEYFAAMGPTARAATATHVALRKNATTQPEEALRRMDAAGLQFPVVAKPDLGWCGYGVRKLEDASALRRYLEEFPDGEDFLLQRYLPGSGEAGLFYMRAPEDDCGKLIGILLRRSPTVEGNGRDSIDALVAAQPRLRRVRAHAGHEWDFDGGRVPAAGECVRLSTVASFRVGGSYLDGSELATPALLARVEAIARDMGEFLVGRFDVRFDDAEALQRGEFTIMEVNGAGSEAVHAWDPKYSIVEGYGIVFAKQRRLFQIAAAQRRRGVRPIPLLELARLWWRQQRLMPAYPRSN